MRNPRLRENVLLGIIEPSRLAVMTPHEMASDDMKELRAKFTKEAIDDYQMAQQGGTKSDLFKCGRCGHRDTTYNQVCQSSFFFFYGRHHYACVAPNVAISPKSGRF